MDRRANRGGSWRQEPIPDQTGLGQLWRRSKRPNRWLKLNKSYNPYFAVVRHAIIFEQSPRLAQWKCVRICRFNSTTCTVSDVCFQERDPGYCDDERLGNWFWTFDAEKGDCERFYFYGCGGNHNRFESRFQCKNICGDRLSPRVEGITVEPR